MQFLETINKKRKTFFSQDGENFKKPKLSFNGGNLATLSMFEKEKICDQKKQLPIFTARARFLEEVVKSDTVVLVGETGSGKTTQIPQFLFEANLHLAKNLLPSGSDNPANVSATCCVGITQPRRVAAISLSHRVQDEMAASRMGNDSSSDGGVVGYKVRFEDATSERTRLIFQTDGMLLREAMIDPLLSRYSWIILDEAHERTVNTDILFGIVKNAQRRRNINYTNRQELDLRLASLLNSKKSQNKSNINNDGAKGRFFCESPLKIIVMSATLDAEKFSAYFRNAPILVVHGRQHPVNIRHVSQIQEDWQSAMLSTIFQIHREAAPQEDILVFLTGQEEIETMINKIRQIVHHDESTSHNFRPVTKLIPLPLYASLQSFGQQKVFAPTKPGSRKVILATNIAETSITIPGIRYVIDSCRVKAKVHLGSIGLDMLQVVRISQAQGLQRTGRAGRQGEGHCYRMLTKNEFGRLPKDTVPEIMRSNLCSVILQMLSIGIKNVSAFDFLEPPPSESVDSAIRQLALIGAVSAEAKPDQQVNGAASKTEVKFVLTAQGKKMSAFPLDPKFTKAILVAKDLGCTEEVITIVSMLFGDQSIFVTPAGKKEEALSSRKKFVSSEGDLITYLNIYRAFNQAKNKIQLCEANSIPVQSCANHTEIVRKALAQGMFTNVARLTREGNYVTLDSSQEVKLHPSSVMFGFKPEIVIFCHLMATQKSYIRDLSLVDPAWLLEAQPEYFRKHRIIVTDN